MGIFKRLRDLTISNINALIDKAEDPVKMTDQYLRDMAEDISDAEAAVAKQIAVQKRLEAQIKEAQEMVEKREKQAIKALEQGNEELARKALQDKQTHQSVVNELTPQYEAAKQTSEKLKAQLQEMKDQYNELLVKRNSLVARAEAAKAQKNINKAMSDFDVQSARAGINRMMDKVSQMEAEAQAGLELRSSSLSLDEELKQLEKSSVDDELEALKAKIGLNKSQLGE